MIYRMLLITYFVLLASGCASWQATADAWKGQKVDDLIARWGPPEKIYNLNAGRKSILFTHSRFIEATQYYCNVTINTDAAETIVSLKVDGNIGGCNRFFRAKGPPD